MTARDQYEAVIGLEVHAQLLTNAKAFCSCSTKFGSAPNSNVCPVCLGLPGSLPVLNRQMVEFTIRMGLSTSCAIAPRSVFARKNYFYPDLPKGYQISQYESPICTNGKVEIHLEDGTERTIGLTRIHMEEDAGKLLHTGNDETLVDANRCGVPLMEIVSEPDLRSAHEAYLFLHSIRQLVTYLGICDGNMEEGSLRCDANVSVRLKGENKLGTKTEVKNLNSFRFVERAIDAEIGRQIDVIASGETIEQTTLLWDADQGVCVPMRSKEEAHDYRYFPDPDLVPVVVDAKWIADAKAALPEFPAQRRSRYVRDYKLPPYDAGVLTAEKSVADYFEEILSGLAVKNDDSFKLASNWTMTDVLRIARERSVDVRNIPIQPPRLAELINLIVDGTISGKIAKQVFEQMLNTDATPKVLVQSGNLAQVSDVGEINRIIDEILLRSKSQVLEFQSGKEQVLGYLVGETMKAMKGKGNPKIVNEVLRKKLAELSK